MHPNTDGDYILNPGNLYLNDELLSKIPYETPPLDINHPPEYIQSIAWPFSVEASPEIECEINGDVLSKLAGFDLASDYDMSCSILFSLPYQEQVRRHKKKRINKKWAKRYGFRTKYRKIRIPEVSIVPNFNSDYEYEFISTGRPEIVKGE